MTTEVMDALRALREELYEVSNGGAWSCPASAVERLDKALAAQRETGPEGPSFDVYKAESDGAWVVHVDTEAMECNADGPYPLRIYVNDGMPGVYENPERTEVFHSEFDVALPDREEVTP
jgi:hypothetical protein